MTAVFFGVFAAFCWSAHDQIARSFAQRIGPFRMALGVMVAGGLLITGYVVWKGGMPGLANSGVRLALISGVAYAFGIAGIFKAFSLGPISIVGPLTAAYPVIVVLWGLASGLVPAPLQWLAIGLTIAGAVVVGRAGYPDGGINAVAPGKVKALLFWCVVCSLGYAVAVVLGQKAGPMIGTIETTWLSRITASLTLLPFLRGEPGTLRLRPVHWWGISAMAGMDVLGHIAVNASGSLPDAEFAAVGISAYAAIGVMMAAVILKERVSMGQWGGIAMIVAGVGLLGLPQ